MKHIIQFQIYKGDTHYVAEGTDFAIVTQAKTLDELTKNILEATALHLEGEDPADILRWSREARAMKRAHKLPLLGNLARL